MLRTALTALYTACDPERDEIFVVDNGSSDGSADQVAASFPQVRLIRNACNNGFARANNQAIGQAQGEFIVLLNNDAFLTPATLTCFEAVFRAHPQAAVVAGQLYDAHGQALRSAGYTPRPLDELGLGFLRRRPRAPRIDGLTPVESVVGACMAVRAGAIQQAGSLDNDFFFYFEETEWCYRLRRHGWSILVEPAAHITHLKGVSTRGQCHGAQLEMLRSRLLFYRKTLPAMAAIALTGYRIARLLLNTLVQALGVILSLGLAPGVRARFGVYALQLVWLMRGCPAQWGLPDKCPSPEK